MSRFERYPAYKDSGIEWIGEIPAHWGIEKGKWLFEELQRPVCKEDEIVTCFRDGTVTLRKNRRLDGFTNALKEHGYQGVRKDDLVIHHMDAFAGAIGISDSDGKCTPVYSVCVPRFKNKVYPRYYALYLRTLAKSGFILSLAKGIRERSTDFRYKDFSNLLLPVPPLPEQKAIAQFLDRKTEQIDRAIAIKERLIERLKEQRKILIHRAVTRGLDPNAPTKDSGIEWIGEIPAHWEVAPGFVIYGEKSIKNEGLIEQQLLSLSYGKLIKKRISEQTGLVPESYETYQIVEPDNIIIRCTDLQNDKTSLRTAISKYNGIITSAYLNLEIKSPKAFPKYISYFLHTLDITKVIYKFGKGLRQNLSFDDFKRLSIILPPLSEQKAITQFLDRKTEQIDRAIKSQTSQIEKLKEYKTSLIDSIVTGKYKPKEVNP